MKQYIDKSAVVAEIEKRIKETESIQPKFDQFWAGQVSAFKGILKILNTIEVKEMDFETEWKKYFEHKGNLATVNVKDLAKHFFELGLKAQKGEEYDRD